MKGVFLMKIISLAKKHTIKLITILTVILAVNICCFALLLNSGVYGASAEITVGETGIEEEYTLGELLTIPEAELDIDGTKQTVRPVVYLPDGTARKVEQITLSQLGMYTLEYSAEKEGIVYSCKKTFVVNEYSWWEGTGAGLKYETPENYNTKGLTFSLYEGEMVQYRKAIDMSKLTKSDILLSVDAIPSNPNEPEARALYIRFTDIYDSSNYITVRWVRPSSSDKIYYAYLTTSFGTTTYNGWLLHSGVNWQLKQNSETGAVIYNGLNGSWGAEGRNKEVQHCELSMDYDNTTMYCYYRDGEQRKLINYTTDFYQKWNKFTTGEVYMSIWAEEYTDIRYPFNGIILELFGEDLTDGLAEDGTVPIVKVEKATDFEIDFGGYGSVENIPNAMVGFPYKVFDYDIAFSKYGGERVDTRVYYGYYSNTRFRVNVENGAFTPVYDGLYTIVYTLTDKFGNTSTKTVDLYAQKKTSDTFDIEVNGFNDYTTGKLGYEFKVAGAENISFNGNLGLVDVKITAENVESNVTLDVKNNAFIPNNDGTWKIKYNATDAVGRKAYFEYDAVVTIDEKVLFQDLTDFPKYAIVGTKNALPLISVIDYTDGGKVKYADRMYAEKDGEFDSEIVGGVFVPTTAGKYTIVYEGTSSVNVNNYKKIDITAVDVGFGDTSSFSLGKYFVSDSNLSYENVDNGLKLSIKNNSVAEFIRPINLADFSLDFFVSGDYSERFTIILTDMNNTNQQVKIDLIKNGSYSVLMVNDKDSIGINNVAFIGGGFNLTLKGKSITVAQKTLTVSTYLNGDEYEGFSSLIGYITIGAYSETYADNSAEIIINKLSGQTFKNVKKDNVNPIIILSGEAFGTSLAGSEIVIPAIKIIDIIDPYVETSMTVRDPSTAVVTDINGNRLEKVSNNQSYTIFAEKMGMYRVVLYYLDQSGNGTTSGKSANFNVIDRTPPEITLGSYTETARVGGTIKIASYSVAETGKKVDVYILVQAPFMRMNELEKSGDSYVTQIKAETKGTYIIRYLAVDEWDNMTIVEYKVKVS